MLNNTSLRFPRIPNMVSVVVPVYNSAPFLSDCLSSLLKQTYENIEIIIVDDGSTDDCKRVVQSWREASERKIADDRLLYFRLPRNTRQPGSATTGLFFAQGEFIACQASDDVSHLERFEKQLAYLRDHPDVQMVGTGFSNFVDGRLDQPTPAGDWLAYGRDEIRKRYALGQHCVCDGTLMMRGCVFDNMGGWTRRLAGVSDFEFIARYVTSGAIVENLREVLYYYRIHSSQTSQRLERGETW